MLRMHFICNLHLCYNFGLVLYNKCTHFQQIKNMSPGCNITIIDPLLPYGPTHAAQRSDHKYGINSNSNNTTTKRIQQKHMQEN